MNTKSQTLIIGLLLAAVVAWAACAAEMVGSGTPGTAGSTGSGTGAAGTTGTGTGVAGSTGAGGSGTGAAGSTGTGTGVAGTTGTGVAGTTGTGTGTGGAGGMVVRKDCATKATIADPVLLNFETYDGTIEASMFGAPFGILPVGSQTPYAGPYSFGDGSATPTLAILAGHPPSSWAVSQTVVGARTWGMGGGIWMGCADASAYKGISFWVRGSSPNGTFSFSLAMDRTTLPNAVNPAGGGICPGTADTCKHPAKQNLPLTADWTQVQILWAELTGGLSGTTAVIPNGNNVTGLGWNVGLQFQLDPTVPADAAGPYVAVPGDLAINIDEISFIP